MKKPVPYFAYGSNMDSARLKERVKRDNVEFEIGCLKNYELVFNKMAMDGKSGYANIQKKNCCTVYGVIYWLTEEELQKLDRCEGVPNHYRRVTLEVQIEKCIVKAVCYVAAEDKVKEGLKPRRDYLQHLVKGAEEHKLPPEYVQRLKEIECIDDISHNAG